MHVHERDRQQDPAHARCRLLRDPLMPNADAQQSDHDDGEHAVHRISEDRVDVLQRIQQETRRKIIRNAEHDAEQCLSEGQAIPENQKPNHAEQQRARKCDQQELPIIHWVACGLKHFVHRVTSPVCRQQQDQAPSDAAFFASANIQKDDRHERQHDPEQLGR